MFFKRIFVPASMTTLLLPAVCSAQSLPAWTGLFNILVGLILTTALLIFGVGILQWVLRFGAWPSYRDEAIKTMQWGVAVLFTLIVLLAVVDFVQNHTQAALTIVAIVVVFVVAIFLIRAAQAGGGGDDDDH